MMSDLIVYLLKVSAIFSILTLVYFIFFRRLTFHKLNRAVLLLSIPISLVLPILNIGYYSPVAYDLSEIEWISTSESEIIVNSASVSSNQDLDISLVIEIAYWIGFAVVVMLLVSNAIKLFHKIKASRKVNSLGFSIIRTEVPGVFSCFKWVFIPKQIEYKYDDPIIKHELAHLRLFHSYDLIITELFIAFIWFNPFVFLFRKLLRSVHEFQADDYVLSDSIKKSDYLNIMLDSLMSTNHFSLASNFKSLTIKNRIEMITKNKNKKAAIMRYALLGPMIALILMSFSVTEGSKPSIKPIEEGKYKRISSGFGKRMHPILKVEKMHLGIDFSTEIGTPIRATGDGIISLIKTDKKAHGKQVQIDHGSGIVSAYCNLNEFAVKEGQKVKKGEVIAYSGNTGASTAPHLHYEVLLNGKNVDPMNYFN